MSARDRIVIGALAAVVALAALWFVGLAPKRKAIAAADTKIAAQQQRLQQAQNVLAQGVAAKREYRANATAVARLGKAVPADDDTASLVYQLQSVAKGAKVVFKSIKVNPGTGAAAATATGTTTGAAASQVAAAALPPGSTVGTAGLPTMPFTFVFEGSYLDMQRFIARVHDLVKAQGTNVAVTGRLLTVDGISLGNIQNDSSAKVRATIAATAYLSPADSSPSATASGSTSTGTPSTDGTASTGTTNTTSAVTPAAGS
jgi:Tfp pilus assembly protein PilO